MITFPIARTTCMIFKEHCFDTEFSCFYVSETHHFWWCSQSFSLPSLALIVDEFGHRLRFHFGTPLVSKSCCFAIVSFDDLLGWFVIDFWSTRQPNLGVVFLSCSTLFPRGFFGRPLAHFGTLSAPFLLFRVPFRLHVWSPSQCFSMFF